MTTTEAIQIIYQQTLKTVGPDKAPATFSITLASLIYDLEQTNSFSPTNLQKAIEDEAELCLKCAAQESVA